MPRGIPNPPGCRREDDPKTYDCWRAAQRRCTDPTVQSYPYYGGRGIQFCARWRNNYPQFLADMGSKPEGMSIDRIDPDGNYEPSNCRWATAKEQRANQRRVKVCV